MSMDFSPLAGNAGPPAKQPAQAYTAQVASPLVNGQAKLEVGEGSLAVTAPLDAADIPYADITALELADYAVVLKTGDGDYTFSRMGSWCRPFFDALAEAYNNKVLQALFVADRPLLKTSGQYRYEEDGAAHTGAATIQLHQNCVCVLPPNLGARRIPLCFLSAFEKGDYDVGLGLQAGERYTFSKLGYDGRPFTDGIEKQLHAIREKALDTVRAVDPSLGAAQAAAVARLMPEGVAAPMGRLYAAAPSFVAAIEAKIGGSRAAESYRIFGELCDPAQIHIGFWKNTARDAAAGPDPYTLWMIAPAPNGAACAVEFAGGDGDAAATFIYHFNGGFEAFAGQLNRALEAIAFKREIIRLSDVELLRPENSDYRMAVQRNRSVRFVQTCFAGRVIHSSPAQWKNGILEKWGCLQG